MYNVFTSSSWERESPLPKVRRKRSISSWIIMLAVGIVRPMVFVQNYSNNTVTYALRIIPSQKKSTQTIIVDNGNRGLARDTLPNTENEKITLMRESSSRTIPKQIRGNSIVSTGLTLSFQLLFLQKSQISQFLWRLNPEQFERERLLIRQAVRVFGRTPKNQLNRWSLQRLAG